MLSVRNIFRNSYPNTKIRVLKGKFPDLNKLFNECSRSSSEDCIKKIAEQFGIQSESPLELKLKIHHSFYSRICRIPGFFTGAQKDFLDAVINKYKIDIIKSKCFSLLNNKKYTPLYDFEDIQKLLEAETLQQFTEASENTFWQNAAEDISVAAAKSSNVILTADSLLGISYFKNLKKQINALDSANKKIVLKIIGPVIDFKKFIFFLRLVFDAQTDSAQAIHMLWNECFFIPAQVFKEIYSAQSLESAMHAGSKYFYGAPVTQNLSEIEHHFYSIQKMLWDRLFPKCQFDIDLALLYILKDEQIMFSVCKMLDSIRTNGFLSTNSLECNVF